MKNQLLTTFYILRFLAKTFKVKFANLIFFLSLILTMSTIIALMLLISLL